ncbi:MAG: substrate-binding domain-containing protein [Candidatus Thermoplasmatota archaeon]|jgi:molybdate/tungstate transport system substrate-binding protein|nr:substrate-binding domain-containing protein [Candidatus Thermoplasmatota archaeon]MCL5794453.1 substrate-binding domain-containing protein [Candidatus Thermoplasmatota archaeon]
MRSYRILAIIVALVLVSLAIYSGLQYLQKREAAPLIVYSADAYVQETNALLCGFHNSTGAPIVSAHGGGSFTDAREIGEGDPANAFISVALQSYNESYLGTRYSGWAVAFASDRLVLAYSSDSGIVGGIVSDFAAAEASNSTAQYRAAFANLTSGQVKLGISDPSSDPAGLRGWISLEIAGYLYASGDTGYFTGILSRDGAVVNSSSAASLVAPLVAGQIQFLFIYKSAAISKGLKYIELPSQLNFGDPALSSFYSRFSYNTAAGPQPGSAIFLFITSLSGNGALTNESLDFALYVVRERLNLSSFGLSPLTMPLVYSNTGLPAPFEQMLSEGYIESAGRF